MAAVESPLIQALRQAVRSAPEQSEFRIALAGALVEADLTGDAIVELGEALRLDPTSDKARELLLRALNSPLSAVLQRNKML